MTPRLTVLLGAGGVGKTTLAAAYAIALGRAGRRAGLLGIDPSFRLTSALGLCLADQERFVPGEPRLLAAVLSPQASFARWVAEASPDAGGRERLARNPFFTALAGRLASATDVFAAVRLTEWVEHNAGLDDLVVDTAPGLNAIEFLRRPDRLGSFLETPAATFLRRIPKPLAAVAGAGVFASLGEFFRLIEPPLDRLVLRLAAARRWMRSGAMRIVLVTAVRDDAAALARSIALALEGLGLSPAALVVNRTLPDAFSAELEAAVGFVPRDSVAFLRYARAYAAMQSRVVAEGRGLAPVTLALSAVRGLDGGDRREALAQLGERLREMLP